MSWSVGSPSFRKESRLPSLAGVPWARPVLQRLATPVVWVDECHTLCYRPQRNQDHPWAVRGLLPLPLRVARCPLLSRSSLQAPGGTV